MSNQVKKITAERRKKSANHLAIFKARSKAEDNNELSLKMIKAARKSGELNLTSKGLTSVPMGVWTINQLTEKEVKELKSNLDFDDDDKDRWWEQEPLKILNCSKNHISIIDTAIGNLSDLIELDVHDNLLQSLPDEMKELLKLKKLNLSHNHLKDVNINLYTLENLIYLDLSYNNLTELSPSIGDLVMLKYLNLSYNNMTKLPIGLGYLVRLERFDASHNLLIELPSDIMSMRALKVMDASCNDLKVSPMLGELRKLETLILTDNKLEVFPNIIGCNCLKELHLSNNLISEIDMDCLETLGQLKSLILANNQVKDIPDGFIQLINLEHLDLSDNNLKLVPNFISIMPNLKYFIINGNEVKNIRSDIIRCGTPRILKHLRQNLNSQNIDPSSSPLNNNPTAPDKFMMKQSKLLSLTNQNLLEIPDSIIEDSRYAGVTCIDLSQNKFIKLPDKLNLIETVQDLKLSCNQLTSLPEWIGNAYENLRYLELSKNKLMSLPNTIGLLQHLREINISQNRFTSIPDCIYEISHLEILIAHGNQIKEIDAKSLERLNRLATLDLSNNDINYVPAELGNQKNLRTLLLSGNLFKQPRQAILLKSTEELLAYLRSRLPIE